MGNMDANDTTPMAATRERLLAAGLFMRYDYAWKEAEFKFAENRLTGIGCRMLYLFEMWHHSAESKRENAKIELLQDTSRDDTVLSSRPKAVIEPNGYAEFQAALVQACTLMQFEAIFASEITAITAAEEVHVVFVYVSPYGEERVDNQYALFEKITAHHDKLQTPPDRRPVFCFLLGEAAFLSPPVNDEAERLRGLSGFAISQRLTPLLQTARYSSVAHFSVEFTPPIATSHSNTEEKHKHLSSLMDQFACVDHNLMHHAEKWEVYASDDSSFVHEVHENGDEEDALASHASQEEVRYWLEYAHGKACNQCHERNDKLLRCSRCGNAFYCSRDCQKAAWKLHKRLCGKKSDEIN